MKKFYTRTGDDGFTSLLSDTRVPKYHLRTEALGTLDEASAALGAARSFCLAPQSDSLLTAAQRDLYHMMSEVAATIENAARFRTIDDNRILWLEAQTDAISNVVNMPSEFIVPGDSQAGGLLSLARTIVRRAERIIAELVHMGEVENIALLGYLNRLSTFCFVLELLENQAAGKNKPTLAKE